MKRTVALTLLGVALHAGALRAQHPEAIQRSLFGPRMGVTYVSGARAHERLREYGLRPVMSQFGWHFEQLIDPRAGAPMFVVQEVFLIGALDQNTAIPSGSLLMGIRLPNGFEFGMGPNVTPVGVALAFGIGKSLRYGSVTLPINLAFVKSRDALRVSFLFGYALDSATLPRRTTRSSSPRKRD